MHGITEDGRMSFWFGPADGSRTGSKRASRPIGKSSAKNLVLSALLWLVDERVFEIANAYPFEYLSCTRAPEPFIHDPSDLMEIPSDLPCLEELGPKKAVPAILEILGGGGIHVLPVHAEVEGGIWASHFLHLLERLREMDYSVLLLSEIRELLRSRPLQKRRFRMKLLPGRSVPCAV